MKTSESIKEIAASLSKAQGQMPSAKKDSANPFFKSQYADLSAVWEAIRKPLSDNGLSVSQGLSFDSGQVIVTTCLMHNSGQWIESSLSLPIVKADPQSIGSACTYGRRYALSAIVGVSADDDDAEATMDRGRNEKPPIKAPEEKKLSPAASTKKTPPPPAPATITEAQRKRLFAMANEAGFDAMQIKEFLLSFGFESSRDITPEKYEGICSRIASGDLKEPEA